MTDANRRRKTVEEYKRNSKIYLDDIHVYTHTYTHTHTNKHTYTHAYTHTHTNKHTYTHTMFVRTHLFENSTMPSSVRESTSVNTTSPAFLM